VDIIKNTKGVSFEDIDYLVFDEADKLLDMGFQEEVKFILESTEN
jgi:superfamily II DNA/RNA helicase